LHSSVKGIATHGKTQSLFKSPKISDFQHHKRDFLQITQKQTNWDSIKGGGATNPVLQIEANMLKSRTDPLWEDSQSGNFFKSLSL
jgi:hypothetical protein